jgi:Domain of unknown function (DU1801)
MYELKTKINDASVKAFLDSVENEQRREDSLVMLDLLGDVTGLEPAMWGSSIVGFGSYHYKYASGHEGDAARIGFSPRKVNLVVYILPGFERYHELMRRLGKYKTGKSCLYITRLADVDLSVLRELARESFNWMNENYPD